MEGLDKYLINEPMTNDKEESFICKGCNCDVSEELCLRTPEFCYLCDPNITLEEVLSDEPIKPNEVERTFDFEAVLA